MALIRLAHPRKLASPAEAEALYRALGEKVVSARGYHTTSPARIARLVESVDVRRDNTVSFEGGVLDRATHDAFVMTGAYHYFDWRTPEGTSLRIWPSQYAWVHTTPELAPPVAAREPATSLDGAATIVIKKRDFATALRVFHAIAAPPVSIERGFAMRIGAAGLELYKQFLLACRPKVDAVLEVELWVARELAELFTEEPHDWQAGGVLVQFPDLTISGYARNHSLDAERDAWFERVDKAVAKL